jgi:hypothetical protein
MMGLKGMDSDELARLAAEYVRHNGPTTTMKMMDALRQNGASGATQRFRKAWEEHGYKYGLRMDRPFNASGGAIIWSADGNRWNREPKQHKKLSPTIPGSLPVEGIHFARVAPPPVQARTCDVQAAVELIAEAFPGFTVGLLLTPKT